jgi:ribonuclease Z
MTSLVRVLSVQSIDSSPSLLIVGPDGKKTLVNCGEGCQRIFLEFGQKISSVERICLTHLQHDAMGGLPGMILTSADVRKHMTAMDAVRKNPKLSSTASPSSISDENRQQLLQSKKCTQYKDAALGPELQLIGPTGTKSFIRSLRHFMQRDEFRIDIHEGTYSWSNGRHAGGNTGNADKKRKIGIKETEESWYIESIVAHYQRSSDETVLNTNQDTDTRQVLSFLFTTPSIPGKFLAEKAVALGIPRGPLYGELKAGKTVTFPDLNDPENNTIITVESHEVVEPKCPGIVVAVLYYPTMHVLQQLKESEQMKRFQRQSEDARYEDSEQNPILEMMVHMAPPHLFKTVEHDGWRKSFGNHVQHMLVPTYCFMHNEVADYSSKSHGIEMSLSPFHTASVGTWMRSQISPDVYHRPLDLPMLEATECLRGITAVPLLEYVVIPRVKRGYRNGDAFITHCRQISNDAQTTLANSGCFEELAKLTETLRVSSSTHRPSQSGRSSEILFTGTGSAVPCKYRNVSGIQVRMDNGNAMLLDCGEGTVGQLLRVQSKEVNEKSYAKDNPISSLESIRAVWISHPHADHHLGLLRLLAEKAKHSKAIGGDSLILIAPPNLELFLKEYEKVVPEIADFYTFLDCRSLCQSATSAFSHNLHQVQERLQRELGITSCHSIRVAHCHNSFAVVFHGTSVGSLAYSGDCRPSLAFAEMAKKADVLIHEATFAAGMEAEAVLKRHCTVSEALEIAKKMEAKTVLLTHFSQRYPKIPPLPTDNDNMTIIPAFDFTKVTLDNMALASRLIPTLRLLYPDEQTKKDDNDNISVSYLESAMDVPGLFARSELL